MSLDKDMFDTFQSMPVLYVQLYRLIWERQSASLSPNSFDSVTSFTLYSLTSIRDVSVNCWNCQVSSKTDNNECV